MYGAQLWLAPTNNDPAYAILMTWHEPGFCRHNVRAEKAAALFDNFHDWAAVCLLTRRYVDLWYGRYPENLVGISIGDAYLQPIYLKLAIFRSAFEYMYAYSNVEQD